MIKTYRGACGDGKYEIITKWGSTIPVFVGTYGEVRAFERGVEDAQAFSEKEQAAYLAGRALVKR